MRQNITSMQTNLFPEGRTYPFFRFTQKRTLRKGFDPLTPRTPKKRKIEIFPFWRFAPIDFFPIAKCALHVISGKAERVSTSDDPTIKIPKPFLPDYKLP